MNVIEILSQMALVAMIVTIVTENTTSVAKPYVNLTKHKLTIALLWTIAVFGSLNVGVLATMGLVTESAWSFIHWVDMALTIALFTTGAQVVHKLADMILEYTIKKGSK